MDSIGRTEQSFLVSNIGEHVLMNGKNGLSVFATYKNLKKLFLKH